MVSDSDADGEQEATRLKTLAESQFRCSNLKSALKHARKAHNLSRNTEGLSSMVTAFEILNSAAISGAGGSPDWYKILQVEPFSHMNSIKQQYRKLALVLHPDKNPYAGCEEAFKLVNEGFRVFSDSTRRKEYDMEVRLRIQEARVSGAVDDETATFWTACSGCRLFHKFERKYLGHNLVCPNCKNSFKAKEVEKENEDRNGDEKRADSRNVASKIITYSRRKTGGRCSHGVRAGGGDGGVDQQRGMTIEEGDEAMTLAQMQSEIKRNKAKVKGKINEKCNSREENLDRDEEEKSLADISVTESPEILKERNNNEENDKHKASRRKKTDMKDLNTVVDLENGSRGDRKRSRSIRSQEEDMEMDIMKMEEESDFYDFKKDRMQRSFRKGQVWAIYSESDDRMPRLYALISDVASLSPFKVFISWLDSENNGNEKLISWRKIRSHIPCGRFRVSKRTLTNRLNIFSHVVDSERAAREVYRIYPKKGSIWAVYAEQNPGFERRKAKRYEIALCLTLYSDIHGLSMVHLQKVDGYRNVFKRREFGLQAIRSLTKDDVELVLSHQIPSKKLPEDQSPDNLKECWVLDLASVPTDLVTTA